MALNYPLINGVRHDWTSLDIKVDGASNFGVKSVDFNDGLEPGDARATGSQKAGRTRGLYDAGGGLELLEYESILLEQQLVQGAAAKGQPGAGLYEVAFDILINVQPEGPAPAWSVLMRGCRITKRTPGGLANGNEALSTKYDLNVTYVIKNGVIPFAGFRR